MIALVFAAALAAGAAAPSAPAAVDRSDSRQVCHKISYLGSRLNSQKICKSKREWDQIQWEHDRQVREGQQKNRTLQTTGP